MTMDPEIKRPPAVQQEAAQVPSLIIEDPLVQAALDLLIQQWNTTENPNAFMFAHYILKNPVFISEVVQRTTKTKINYTVKKSLLDRVCSKLTSHNKNTGGKKLKTRNLVYEALKNNNKNLSVPLLLLLVLVRSVPNYDIRRLKYGSGHLTKIVTLTVARKITWFLKEFAQIGLKKKESFSVFINKELQAVLNNSTRSKLLTKKREAQQNAIKANLQ